MSPEQQVIRASIETARLSLRRLAVGDRAFYCGLYADPAVMRLVGPPLDRARALRAFERLHAGSANSAPGFRVWVIHERGCPEPIGLCGLTARPPGAGSAGLGILLGSCGLARAGERAEVFRAAVAAIEHPGLVAGLTVSMTMSIGVASSEQMGYHWSQLMAAADAALYRAKHKGRNRVELVAAAATHP